jgi:RecB family exonuclease
MQIPNATLSASQLRKYGTGGFTLTEHESEKGCPRQYKARYVDGLQEEGPKSYPLLYGSLFHDIMFKMEEDGLTPDDALAAAWEPWMPQEAWTEAREDLDNYMARGATPADRFGTLEVEAELKALLYVDEEYGPTYYRGFLDMIGIDLELPNVLHSLDYKTNRQPPKTEDMQGDVQLRGYDWLLRKNYERWMKQPPRIVTHLDVIKYRDMEIVYSDADIEDWESWAIAVARKIWRDNEALPILNEGCAFCFVQDTCPAFNALPSLAEKVLEEGSGLTDPVYRLAWMDKANSLRLLLEKSVTKMADEFKSKALTAGKVIVGDDTFEAMPAYKDEVNLRRLHELLAEDKFYEAISASKTSVQKALKGMDVSERAEIESATIERVVSGTKVVRTKAKG